jgi:hypothetical protein
MTTRQIKEVDMNKSLLASQLNNRVKDKNEILYIFNLVIDDTLTDSELIPLR